MGNKSDHKEMYVACTSSKEIVCETEDNPATSGSVKKWISSRDIGRFLY